MALRKARETPPGYLSGLLLLRTWRAARFLTPIIEREDPVLKRLDVTVSVKGHQTLFQFHLIVGKRKAPDHNSATNGRRLVARCQDDRGPLRHVQGAGRKAACITGDPIERLGFVLRCS